MSSPFGQVLLVTGNAEFEAERMRKRAVEAVVATQPECQITESTAAGLQPGELMGLTSASLFSDATAVVLTELQDLPDHAHTELLAYAEATSPDVAVVLVHSGGNKGKGLLDKLRKLAAVTEVKVEAPKYERGHAEWVQREAKSLGSSIDAEAAMVLVQAVGQDLRALAGAVSQLVVAVDGALDTDLVKQYFGGRAEVRGFEISDAILSGRLHVAMESNRWAESARTAPLVIMAAVAGGLRSLAKLESAPAGLRDADLASQVGVPPFKLRALRQQLAGWDGPGLAIAIAAVAEADRDLKTGDADGPYAVERMLLKVASARIR